MKHLVVVAGPTAAGKTALAILLAAHWHTEIVSFDSRQCYCELNIGVARPSPGELAAVPHHFIANRSVLQPYNVASYEAEAMPVLHTLFHTHPVVVAVGGSGLYMEALCHGVATLPDPAPGLREQLQHLLATDGIEALQQRLQQLDPEYYATVDRHNPVRLQRALEVCYTTGRPYSHVLRQQQQPAPRDFAVTRLAVLPDSVVLRARIDQRVESMIAAGLVDEVRHLVPYRHLMPLHSVGYRELFQYLDGGSTLPQAVELIQRNTWQYARKQQSWLRRYDDLITVTDNNTASLIEHLDSIITP